MSRTCSIKPTLLDLQLWFPVRNGASRTLFTVMLVLVALLLIEPVTALNAAPVPIGSEARMDPPVRQANGSLEIGLRASPGRSWSILASSDLVTWTLIGSEVIAGDGLMRLPDPGADGSPRRFYRARADEQVVLPAPQEARATTGENGIRLSWAAVPEATSYNVYWSSQPGPREEGAKVADVTGTSWEHAGAQPNTTYYYVITAVNAGGESAPCQEISARLQVEPSADPAITIEVVDNGGDNGWNYKFTGHSSAIAVGPDNSVHIVFSDNSNGMLKYAKKAPGGNWSISAVESLKDSRIAVSITVDRGGTPHIVWGYDTDSLNSLVKYASFTEDRWAIETVATVPSGWYSYAVQVLVTEGGIVHLLYSGKQLHHAVRAGSSWTKTGVADMGVYPWRATQKANDLYVSHGTYGIGERLEIFIYDNTAKSWMTRTFKPALTCTEQTPLAVDSQGRINVVGWGRGDGLTWIRISQNLQVEASVLDNSSQAGQACDMVMDAADVMHVAFSVYDYWGGKWLGTWYYRVQPDGKRKWYVIEKNGDYRARSIAGDSLGNYHVTYYDAVRGDLKYARIAYRPGN